MIFGGFQQLSLIDYPGKICAIAFTTGCNFRCAFCHNKELVLPELIAKQPIITEDDILTFLKTRIGKLEALCITGGEPSLYDDLDKFLQKIKQLGFLIKLDTNGTNPTISSKFGIRNIPTVLFFKNGQAIDKQVGAVTKSIYVNKINVLLQ